MTGDQVKELSGNDIHRLLGLLDQELQRRGQAAKLYVVGGANITLALDQSRTTNDIDVVVKQGFDIVFDAAKAVSDAEPGLGPDWMNSDFTAGKPDGGMSWSWMDNKEKDQPSIGYQGPALTVELASPRMMLALKTLANRAKDRADIYLLMEATGIRTPDELGRNLAQFTGRRIFDEQGRPGMPFHIDPAFSDIFEDAPPHLRSELPPRASWWVRFTGRQRKRLS